MQNPLYQLKCEIGDSGINSDYLRYETLEIATKCYSYKRKKPDIGDRASNKLHGQQEKYE